jgi:hypothetical protein
MPDEPVALLHRCDGLTGPHYGRQRCRLVRIREHDAEFGWVEVTKALCLDCYRQLRHQAEPRHPVEGA